MTGGGGPEATQAQQARRRIMVAAFRLASVLTIPTIIGDFGAGYAWVVQHSVRTDALLH